jgi:hypothetical protein
LTLDTEAYAESKPLDVLLAFGVARRWQDVVATALEPGWVPTRMGGPAHPMTWIWRIGCRWLATSKDPRALTSGGYYYPSSAGSRTRSRST